MPTSVVWEEVACPLCGKRDQEPILEHQPADSPVPFRIVRCRACRMSYLNPRPNEETIGQFYPDQYQWYQVPQRPARWWGAARKQLRQLAMSHRYGTPPAPSSRLEQALGVIAASCFAPPASSMTALPYVGKGRLLDYGCGAGWYAQQMQQLGWNVTAMDFSAHAAAQVRRHFGLPTLVGSLPHPEVRPASFDVITMGAVLEHVHDPHRVIAAAVDALALSGYLVVSVPNFASWGARRFGASWWGLQLPHHLLHFTPATLHRLLAGHGLIVRDVQVVAPRAWMRRSLAKARADGDSGPLVRACRTRIAASALCRWLDWRGDGDCLQMIAYRPGSVARSSRAA